MRGYRGPTAFTIRPGDSTVSVLGAIRFTLMFTVPTGTDRRLLAQELADEWHVIRYGEQQFSASAEVHVPEGLLPSFDDGDQESLVLGVRAWAERPWLRDGEYRRTAMAFLETARSLLDARHPVPRQAISMMPLDDRLTDSLVSASTFVARTAGPLPGGWEEHLAKHR